VLAVPIKIPFEVVLDGCPLVALNDAEVHDEELLILSVGWSRRALCARLVP
jgi:hypothetical protein